MKLDQQTLSVLKNFVAINPSILVKPGDVIATISPSKTIFAKAKVPTEFTKRFAIYELSRFISAVTMLSDPDLEFGDTSVTMKDKNGRVLKYSYAAEDTIKALPPEKDIKLPSVEVEFKLTSQVFKDVVKASGVLGLEQIAVVGDGTTVSVRAVDPKATTNSNSNEYAINVGETDATFRAVFTSENITKVAPGDYDVSISSKGLARFEGSDMTYWIAVESSSSF